MRRIAILDLGSLRRARRWTRCRRSIARSLLYAISEGAAEVRFDPRDECSLPHFTNDSRPIALPPYDRGCFEVVFCVTERPKVYHPEAPQNVPGCGCSFVAFAQRFLRLPDRVLKSVG